MERPCEHLEGLGANDFPLQKTPGACEECLTGGTVWLPFASAKHAVTWAAAIHRPASTPPTIFKRPTIPSCALFRPRLGYGAISMNSGNPSLISDARGTLGLRYA
jgi:hypothetical protein